jgi:hypothetical protein
MFNLRKKRVLMKRKCSGHKKMVLKMYQRRESIGIAEGDGGFLYRRPGSTTSALETDYRIYIYTGQYIDPISFK